MKKINYYTFLISPKIQKNHTTPERIFNKTCEVFNISPKVLKGKTRSPSIVIPRQLYSYFAKKQTNASLEKIASLIGQNHTSVLYSIKRVGNMILTKDNLYQKYINTYKHL